MDGGKVVDVFRHVEADRLQTIAYLDRSHWHTRSTHDESNRLGETERDRRSQAEQLRERADRLRELGEALVDRLTSRAELLVLADRRLERAAVVLVGH